MRKREEIKETNSGLMQRPADISTEADKWAPKIKPDYERIRNLYLMICAVSSVVILIMQIALYAVFKLHLLPLEFKTSEFVHLLKYLIIPSVINFSVTIGTKIFLVKYKKNEFVLNMAPIFATTVLVSATASAHSVYPVTLSLFFVPLFMVSIFGMRKPVYVTSGLCAIGVAAALFCRAVSPYRPNPDTKFIPEAIIAYVILATATAMALITIMLLDKQKRKLIESTSAAHRARQQATEANRAKTEFLANMSHEIRTPLNAVIGLTEMITRKADDPEILEYAADIQMASNALLATINDILDISKIETGRIEIRESNYELGSLINDSYNMVASRWREKGLTAKVICDPMLPRILYGDEYHLRQIIVNLLSNAVKYTHEGSIELRVSGEENGDILRMEVAIKGTGIGIKEEDLPKLFEKFTRRDMVKNRKIEGTGLGLSITKQLVELMNGTITVESVYGVGSTFTVRIPQKIADRTPIGDVHTSYLDIRSDIEQYVHSFEAPEARILAVDDMEINLQLIRRLLQDTKIKIDTAYSGRECLEKVMSTHYDLILMDHMMPEMDGIETLKAMKLLESSENEGVPVIMLTANAMVGAREEYIKAGFVDYLSKPVRGAKLESVVMLYLPEEKVVRIEPHEKNSAKKAFTAASVREILPEIDTRLGVSLCADDEGFYITMLKTFASGERDKRIKDLYDNGDINNYRIEVHSLKTAAKTVGLSALSDECLALEKAAKEGNAEFIKAHTEPMLAHYRAVADALSKLDQAHLN